MRSARPLSTLEIVLTDTPALRATSAMVLIGVGGGGAGKAAGGYAPALGCGSPPLRGGFPAVLVLVARGETRCAHCVRFARTIATSQMLERAARAATSPAFLGAAYVAADAHPPAALRMHRSSRRTPRASPRGGWCPVGAISG